MKFPSASKLDRAFQCPASVTLPGVDHDNDYAAMGRDSHKFFATGELPEDPELRAKLEHVDMDALPLPRESFAAEVAFAWDYVTGAGRELGRDLGRDYSKATPYEFVGTADLVSVADDAVIVPDWKMGHAWLPRPLESWQLRFLALAAARAYGKERALVGFIRVWDSEPKWFFEEMDAFELEVTASELVGLVARIEKNDEPPKPGAWCRYCPAFQDCPAQTSLIRQMASSPAAVAEEIRGLLTPETAAIAYQRLHMVKEAIKAVDKALYAYATEHPISLPDGRVFGPTTTTKKVISGDVAFRVLTEKYGEEVALAACEMDASQASIERALRKVATKTGEKLAPLKRAALQELEAAGGITLRTSHTVREQAAGAEPQPQQESA